jgi:hypothetical protein
MQKPGCPGLVTRRVTNLTGVVLDSGQPRSGRGQLVTHCVTNSIAQEIRIRKKELSEKFKIRSAISNAKVPLKPLREPDNQFLTISGFSMSPLLLFHDLPSNQPVGDHLGRINRTSNARPCRFENLPNALIERWLLFLRMRSCLSNTELRRHDHTGPLLRHLEKQQIRQLLRALSACLHRQAVLSRPKDSRHLPARLPGGPLRQTGRASR